ncbi:MAG: hypothetical protein QOE75_1526 [Solirubrobacterales bacterium]|jgi:hypothetical protein|nr:hypothetical protein [Solirubrobacterales bacterium]
MNTRLLTLIGIAICLVAVAGPATASANWTHEGSELEEDAEIEMSGPANIALSSGVAGAHFTIHLKGTLSAISRTGQLNSVTVTGCTGTGALNGLSCTGTVSAIPWQIHWDPLRQSILITGVNVTLHFYSSGSHTTPVAQTNTQGSIVATPDNAEAFGAFGLDGEGMTTNGNSSTMEGELAVTPSETFGGE